MEGAMARLGVLAVLVLVGLLASGPVLAQGAGGDAGAGDAAGASAPSDVAPGAAPAGDAAAGTQRDYVKEVLSAPSVWDGFYIDVGLGFANHGGQIGPVIPGPSGTSGFSTTHPRYGEAVRTDIGDGFAFNLELGYTILGFATVAADISWSGRLGSKINMEGAAAAGALLGVHPLRFYKADLPVDSMLYVGVDYTFMYYHEDAFQQEVEGKGWLGTAIPFGLRTWWHPSESSPLVLGIDLRLVKSNLHTWIYSQSDGIESDLSDDPVSTTRFEPRLILGWHY
jgi:hypothetical protein